MKPYPKPKPRPFSTVELILILAVGLFIGAVVAGFVLLETWLLLQGSVAEPLPTAISVPVVQATLPPSSTPLPTIPVQTIPLAGISGGTVSTTSGAVKFTLATGAAVFVAPDTEVELTQLPAAEAENRHTLLTLLKGRVLIVASLEPGDSFIVQTPTQDMAEVEGSVMGVEYDPQTLAFGVDCLEGHCRLGKSSDPSSGTPAASMDLAGGQYSFQTQGSPPSPPENSRNELWQPLGGDSVPAANTPTSEPTAEAATPADRASACGTFQAQFPGTPCP